MNRNKIIFYLAWILLVSLGPIAVWNNSNIPLTFANKALTANFFQRITGVMAFSVLFIQIILGAYMHRWTDKLGGWVLKFHSIEGGLIYILFFLHPILFTFFNYFYGKPFDPIYVFLQVCLLCKPTTEYFYTLGRIAFWLINITVIVAVLRNGSPFMRLHWKKIHALNYLIFLIVGAHGLFLGTDFMSMPFFAFAISAYLIVLYILIFNKLSKLLQNVSSWLT